MKKSKDARFLSSRMNLLTFVMLSALLVMALWLLAEFMRGRSVWPPVAALAVHAVLTATYYFWVVRPFRKAERGIDYFLEGYTISTIQGEEGVSLSPASARLGERMKAEFDATHLLKLSKRQAQFRALQNQINPHFLYNTLESIRSEALISGLDGVAEMTEALAVFFRYTISKVENLVTVEEELQNCETYFRIQRYRFGERLQLQMECDPEERDEIYRCRMPKLTLQPILENSIIHGTEFKIGAGRLLVRLERTSTRLLIQVSDDGVGMDSDTLAKLNERLGKSGQAFQENASGGGGLALTNVNNRIHLLFGEEYGLTVYSMPGLGTDVHISLPIITSNRETMGGDLAQ